MGLLAGAEGVAKAQRRTRGPGADWQNPRLLALAQKSSRLGLCSSCSSWRAAPRLRAKDPPARRPSSLAAGAAGPRKQGGSIQGQRGHTEGRGRHKRLHSRRWREDQQRPGSGASHKPCRSKRSVTDSPSFAGTRLRSCKASEEGPPEALLGPWRHPWRQRENCKDKVQNIRRAICVHDSG